jgi:RNA polymerase sigma-32 factor
MAPATKKSTAPSSPVLTFQQQQLVINYRHFAIKIASKYHWSTLAPEDLVGWGMLGLVEAALRFDPSRGLAFGTYAGHWVRSRVLLAITRAAGWKNNQRINHLFWRLWSDTSSEELARTCGLDAEEVDAWRAVLKQAPLPLDQLDNWQELASDSPSPAEVQIDDDLRAKLTRAIAQLPTTMRRVIALRFSESEPTLEEIGSRMQRSREWVRLVERHAIELLRELMEDA